MIGNNVVTWQEVADRFAELAVQRLNATANPVLAEHQVWVAEDGTRFDELYDWDETLEEEYQNLACLREVDPQGRWVLEFILADYWEDFCRQFAEDAGMVTDAIARFVEWKKFREIIFSERGRICEKCGNNDTDTVFDLHHLTYVRFGKEFREDVQIVCRDCHEEIHEKRIATKRRRSGAVQRADGVWVYKAAKVPESREQSLRRGRKITTYRKMRGAKSLTQRSK